MTASKKYGGLLFWLLLSYAAGFIGSLFEPGLWYQTILKPGWTPPNAVFPIVWPLLYTLMGVAAWRIWYRIEWTEARRPLQWFVLQLALNAAWSWLFFGTHNVGVALAELLLLWTAILFTCLLFWVKDRLAGALLVPYLLWTAFAAALNFAIWQLN